MAANQSVVLLLLALLSLTATSTISAQGGSGYVVNGNPIAKVVIFGHLYCSARGNFSPGAFGLPGVNVILRCNGSSTDVAQAFTDIKGTYVFLLHLANGIPFDPSQCAVIVRLPIATCHFLPPTGTLRALITLLNTVPTVFGFVANFFTGAFELIDN